jgi:hypothetical protein
MPMRRPFVRNGTAALLMTDDEEVDLLALQSLGYELRLLVMLLDQACEELCLFIAINAQLF